MFREINAIAQDALRKRSELLGMRWVWSLGGLGVRELAVRTVREARRDDVFGRAAQLSYFFFLSLFPLIIFGVAVAGRILGSDPSLYSGLLDYLATLMPDAAFTIVRDALHDVTSGAGAAKISLGLVLTLWSGAAGMVSVIEGLNAAYGIREFRSWWKRRLVAIALTVVVLVLGISALTLVIVGGRLEQSLANWAGAPWLSFLWAFLHWTAGILFMLIVFDLVYLFAPNLKGQRWQAILPGSLVALLCWCVTSIAFKIYLQYYDSFTRTYGALGAVIILLLWLYLTGVAILLGGEVNSEIRNAAAAAGAVEAIRTRESAP
ncbi:MAG TPA: YihY/virulence factor BrkB family protein [Bryobacteraceae bacterium]|nr:YihY/virulence factor BrkB family protein [Bryobacteraceae bacterium]